MGAADVWRALTMFCIDVYIGPTHIVAHDAGSTLMSRAFQLNMGLMNIKTKPVAVESPNTISLVERYHEPVRRAYRIIRIELPNILDDEALQYAMKSVNESVSPDGWIPILLVYGALPRLGFLTYKPAPGVYQR